MSEEDDAREDAFTHLDADHPSRNRDYEVGKFKPPIASRIKPGERRNPKGRPRSRKSPTELLNEFYMQKIRVRVGDKTVWMTRLVAEAHILHGKALTGDIRALKESRALAASAGMFVENLEPPVEILDDGDEDIIADFMARKAGKPSRDSDKGTGTGGEDEQG